MRWPSSAPKNPEKIEKAMAGLCYLTVGLIGLLYIILSGKSSQSPFFRFHFLQSIILGVLGCLISWAASIFLSIMLGILGLFGDAANSPTQLLCIGAGFLGRYGYLAGILLLLYGAVFAFLGRYAEIPIISKLVRQQMR
jgi:uncharacterized membrane protein